MIKLTLNRTQLQKSIQFLKSVPERLHSFLGHLTHTYAQASLRQIKKKIPKGLEYRSYRKAFEVAKITGIPDRQIGYAVRVNPKVQKIRASQSQTTILYVKPQSNFIRIPADVQVLIDYSPWPVDMLPFTPDRRFARVVSRKVRRDEIDAIRENRREDKKEWRPILDRTGRREARKPLVRLPKSVKALPDVAFQALRLEYGLGGGRSQAHWRPGIKSIVSLGIFSMIKRRKLGMFFDPAFAGWVKLPSVQSHIPYSEAEKYEAFQKRLSIRVGGTR